MTSLYFVRHAQPDYSCRDDAARPLTPQGRRDTALVTAWLEDKDIAAVYSSPYARAVDTIAPFAALRGLEVTLEPDLRERKITEGWIEDFAAYARRQWEDLDYALPGGESLRQVRRRCLAAAQGILARHPGQGVAVAGHGTALCALASHYHSAFGYEGFLAMKDCMPWGLRMDFDREGGFAGMEAVDLFGL